VESRTPIAKAHLTGAKLAEIPGGPRHYIIIEAERDATSTLVIDIDIELEGEGLVDETR
jgi:hypothetical protein